jgi:hypothetical protein
MNRAGCVQKKPKNIFLHRSDFSFTDLIAWVSHLGFDSEGYFRSSVLGVQSLIAYDSYELDLIRPNTNRFHFTPRLSLNRTSLVMTSGGNHVLSFALAGLR